MKIAAVIPTFNRGALLERFLTQLHCQDLSNIDLVVVVVVDGSTDGTVEMINRCFKEVHTVQGTENWWYTKSMNYGFKYAEQLKPDYILTLNDDVEIEPDYVQKLADATRKVGSDSIMGSISFTSTKPCKVIFSGLRDFSEWKKKGAYYYKRFTEINPNDLTGIRLSYVLPGRGMLIPLNVLKTLKYFDEKFVQYGSDDDFCLRARKKGFNVYISWDARVFSDPVNTDKNSAHIKPSILEFTKSHFNKYSRNSLLLNYRILRIYGHSSFYIPFLIIKRILLNYRKFIIYKMKENEV